MVSEWRPFDLLTNKTTEKSTCNLIPGHQKKMDSFLETIIIFMFHIIGGVYPRDPKSSSHTWWGSVFGPPLKGESQEMFCGYY